MKTEGFIEHFSMRTPVRHDKDLPSTLEKEYRSEGDKLIVGWAENSQHWKGWEEIAIEVRGRAAFP